MSFRSLFLTAALLLTSAPAHATTRYDITLPGSDAAPHYWIVILARPAGVSPVTPGHTFVEFGHESDDTHSTQFEAWGFYPEGGNKTFQQVPGTILDDVKSGSLSKRTVVVSIAVPKAKFDAAKKARDDWASQPPAYQLFTARNCIDFSDAVAKVLGLKTPDRSTIQTPIDYVDALGKKNSGAGLMRKLDSKKG